MLKLRLLNRNFINQLLQGSSVELKSRSMVLRNRSIGLDLWSDIFEEFQKSQTVGLRFDLPKQEICGRDISSREGVQSFELKFDVAHKTSCKVHVDIPCGDHSCNNFRWQQRIAEKSDEQVGTSDSLCVCNLSRNFNCCISNSERHGSLCPCGPLDIADPLHHSSVAGDCPCDHYSSNESQYGHDCPVAVCTPLIHGSPPVWKRILPFEVVA